MNLLLLSTFLLLFCFGLFSKSYKPHFDIIVYMLAVSRFVRLSSSSNNKFITFRFILLSAKMIPAFLGPYFRVLAKNNKES